MILRILGELLPLFAWETHGFVDPEIIESVAGDQGILASHPQ